MDKTLKGLIISAINGDKASFGEIYEFYSVDMYRFALSICKDKYDAEDAVQETVISVYKSIASIKNPEKFKSYLFLSLSNTCKRKMGKKVKFEEIPFDAKNDEFVFTYPVKEALSNLDNVSREIIMLSVVAGFKSKEIGKMMNIPPSTVRTKERRALQKIRKELEL